jgi:hypothetical protein
VCSNVGVGHFHKVWHVVFFLCGVTVRGLLPLNGVEFEQSALARRL